MFPWWNCKCDIEECDDRKISLYMWKIPNSQVHREPHMLSRIFQNMWKAPDRRGSKRVPTCTTEDSTPQTYELFNKDKLFYCIS